MFRPLLFFCTITLLLTACSSGKTALKRGHFDLAVKNASHRLLQRPGLSKRGHPLATQVLRQAFLQAYEQHQSAIRTLSAPSNSDAFRWETVYKEYTALQALTDNARTCNTCAEWLDAYPASYADRLSDTRQLAAADRYEAAEQAFTYREENRLAAKDAYQNYLKALDWVPDYRQARAKAEDALPFAILRVVVEPLSPTREISAYENAELQRLILRKIGEDTAPSKLVRLYPPDETAGEGYPIHQAVQMVVTDYTPYRENTSSSSTTIYSNQTYKVGEKKINDSTKVDIMEKVSGTLTTYRREIHAGLDLRMRALDTETGKIRWEESVWESRNWQTEWQSFSGDQRALNGQSLKSADLFPPSRWQLYDSMQYELAADVARRLRSKYTQD
ncbi:hypothetical protein [Spirosoma sp.]|uniref:hypothetical protein n=1 Tax=Spirosoma sp. TaxID=1899569 RepID=UPI003B3AD9CA